MLMTINTELIKDKKKLMWMLKKQKNCVECIPYLVFAGFPSTSDNYPDCY